MNTDLHNLARFGWLRRVDAALGELVLRLFPDSAPAVGLAAALAARAIADGHSALQLDAARGWLAGLGGRGEAPELPDPSAWIAALRDSAAVGLVASLDEYTTPIVKPLVLDAQGRVYLTRYFDYERQLAGQLLARAQAANHDSPLPLAQSARLPPPQAGGHDSPLPLAQSARLPPPQAGGHDSPLPLAQSARLPPPQAGGHDSPLPLAQSARLPPPQAGEGWRGGDSATDDANSEQARAARTTLRNRFTLITGGPGTGKTTSVVRIVALLAQRALHEGRELRVALAAPTGKAAARLAESIRAQKTALALPGDIARQIPEAAGTLHRLLGLSPHRPQPEFHRDAPLPCDAVIVDEVSMVDLPLMTRLVDAVPASACLVLLGDPRQLAAVEAGDVLGALVDAARTAPLAACHVELTRSHRFAHDSALGRLAATIADGDADAALSTLQGGGTRLVDTDTRGVAQGLVESAVRTYQDLFDAADPAAALAASRNFCVLTALRHGSSGCIALNHAIEQRLKRIVGVRADTSWWRGRLILITANRVEPGLFNGDIGVVWPDAGGNPRVWFAGIDGGLRALGPAALPTHEGAFALTVHKAQGSEFERVALVTGPDSPVLTRELLYTGVTRARAGLEIYSDEALLRAGIARRMRRWNGLADRLREAATAPTKGSIAESLPRSP